MRGSGSSLMAKQAATSSRAIFQSPAYELIICFRELAALYTAGIPFSRALYIVSQQVSHPLLQRALRECLRNITSGWSITNALSIYPGLFPELYIRLIEVGENTGKLEQMLEKIAQHAEKTREKTQKFVSALAYPSFIAAICLAFLIIGPSFVFKDILLFLKDLHIPLPIATRILIILSAILRSPIFLILFPLFLLGVAAILSRLWKARYFKKRLQDLILWIPGIGKLLHISEVASVARALAITCESGVPIMQGIRLTKKIVSFVELQDALDSVEKAIIDGESVTEAFTRTNLFPPVLLQFMNAGEQTGELGPMLNWAAWMCEQNVDHSLSVLLEALQPIVIFLVGIVVAFIIAATMGPMLKISQGLV